MKHVPLSTRVIVIAVAAMAAAVSTAAVAADSQVGVAGALDKQSAEKAFPAQTLYSPYAGRNFPTRPYFGDTHLHTSFSMDAGAFGARLTPRDAYVFAKGNEERRGDAMAQDAARVLAGLQSSDEAVDPAALGDPTLLERQFEDVPLRDIAAQFGDEFADRVAGLPVGQWQGPIESGYGMHLVLIGARTDGRAPELDEVRDALRRDWLNEQGIAANEAYYQSLLQRYTVTIEGRE